MDIIIEFLLNNLDKIIYIVISITVFIITLCRKTVKIVENKSWLSDLLLYLPGFIILAEQKFGAGNGKEKFNYVFDLAIKKASNLTGIKDEASLITAYGSIIQSQIEQILSAPSKKED